MKRKQIKNYIKVCGKNCKWNKEHINDNRKSHYCFFTMKRCGLNHTCDCFKDGKFRFERKDNL